MPAIVTFTGTRAEFGLLKDLLSLFSKDRDLMSHLIVSGSHLSEGFGDTSDEIKPQYYNQLHKIPIDGVGESETSIVYGLSQLSTGMASILNQAQPDAIMLLGDRYELLPVANAALIFNVPIIHLSGGDITLGAIDNKIRHALSKMADLHLVTNESAYRQLLMMGVLETDIHLVGIPSETGRQNADMDINQALKKLEVKKRRKLIVSTFHPETLIPNTFDNLRTFCDALTELAEPDVSIIVTGANGDKDGVIFNRYLKDLAGHHENIYFIESLGLENYHLIVEASNLVMGNSSSGLTEAPSLSTPTLDIGERQSGRTRGPSVFHSTVLKKQIVTTAKDIISGNATMDFTNPYTQQNSVANSYLIIRQWLNLRGTPKI